jgi:hypothetical protein
MRPFTFVLIFGALVVLVSPWRVLSSQSATPLSESRHFVGTQTCADCHEEQYETFKQYARKAHSFESIQKMQKGLTQQELKECYACHTTGYGQPGGFVSLEKTPHLKNAGCEVCHGPGSAHVESEDPDDIVTQLDMASCLVCHNSERVANFKFKPLLYGGAH